MTDDDDILAAEFALGLLDEAEGDAVQRRAATDAVLSLRIAWWRDQLAPLAREVETPPSEGLWPRIAGQLAVNDNVSTALGRWRAAAVAAMSVAAALIIFIGVRPDAPVPVVKQPAPMIAALSGETGSVVAVSYDATSGRLTVAPTTLDPGKGDAELWIIPEDGKPRSLGLIDAARPHGSIVATGERAFVHPGATFAISLEPKGGAPNGAPTGPVVATGRIVRV